MYTETVPHFSNLFSFHVSISASHQKPLVFTTYHQHKEIEFIKIIGGKMRVDFENDSIVLDSGDLLILNSNVSHSTATIAEHTQQMLFQSDISLLYIKPSHEIKYSYFYSFLNQSSKPYYYIPNKSTLNKELTKYITNIYHETQKKEDMFEMYLKSYLNLLSACLNRNKIFTNDFDCPQSLFNKIAPIVNYIDENYATSLSLFEISQILHMNKYYMCRLFKTVTNNTIFNYITHIRICKAENLLTQTSLSITDIALSLGFANATRFDETFKKITGTTPMNYRKNSYSIQL